jgi:hypothetical protein|mmetsp:Transcript_6302/g.11771  ORF Transcript_6302/g.11771 Transcript_6302/m.11771 type:complete len:273 (-) Transcript_6302:1121-1939(-)
MAQSAERAAKLNGTTPRQPLVMLPDGDQQLRWISGETWQRQASKGCPAPTRPKGNQISRRISHPLQLSSYLLRPMHGSVAAPVAPIHRNLGGRYWVLGASPGPTTAPRPPPDSWQLQAATARAKRAPDQTCKAEGHGKALRLQQLFVLHPVTHPHAYAHTLCRDTQPVAAGSAENRSDAPLKHIYTTWAGGRAEGQKARNGQKASLLAASTVPALWPGAGILREGPRQRSQGGPELTSGPLQPCARLHRPNHHETRALSPRSQGPSGRRSAQ